MDETKAMLQGSKSALCLMIDKIEPLQDTLVELYCDFQYGLTLEQMLIEGDDSDPELKTKQDYVQAMTSMIMFDNKWNASFMEHVMNNL